MPNGLKNITNENLNHLLNIEDKVPFRKTGGPGRNQAGIVSPSRSSRIPAILIFRNSASIVLQAEGRLEKAETVIARGVELAPRGIRLQPRNRPVESQTPQRGGLQESNSSAGSRRVCCGPDTDRRAEAGGSEAEEKKGNPALIENRIRFPLLLNYPFPASAKPTMPLTHTSHTPENFSPAFFLPTETGRSG
jgi:hypothetical protein